MDAHGTCGFTSVFVGIETPTPAALIASKKKQNVRKDDLTILSMPYKHSRRRDSRSWEDSSLILMAIMPDALETHIRFIQSRHRD